MNHAPNAVARLRDQRIDEGIKPIQARGWRAPRCSACRVIESHCLCAWRPSVETRSGVCLIMTNKEVFKPSNTGWLIADVVRDNHAFIWSRTDVDEQLLALLNDPQWQPYLVFPGEYVEPSRVTHAVDLDHSKRPLFILLDATWTEARKIFRKSPYFDRLPILSLLPDRLSRYRLRRSTRSEHLCTAEVAALCLELAGDSDAASALDAYFDVFSQHYLGAKEQQEVNLSTPAHAQLQAFIRRPQAVLAQ
ncbi:tRNA-uridine aminocarboxypropyltransferase [Pseudomonas fluorescens]|uniref:tRNA-uridine aminocarboxypropyltransferase n=1 Tax=Pseudomonas fluorescens TaxID=294 RepID=UPI000CA134E8|nr:tRNA-uridine aminocarboxypropyltransferase [Pseudomonas fluorescens]AUM68542.1 DTW domain-containing protein [Pseudomonas fluorescens]